MSQRISGSLGLTLVAMFIAFCSFAAKNGPSVFSFNSWETFVWVILAPGIAAFFSFIVGFFGGAFKKGGFANSFFWAYLIVLTLIMCAQTVVVVRYFYLFS